MTSVWRTHFCEKCLEDTYLRQVSGRPQPSAGVEKAHRSRHMAKLQTLWTRYVDVNLTNGQAENVGV